MKRPFLYSFSLATVYKGNIIKNLIMDCQSYTKYRPNETTVCWMVMEVFNIFKNSCKRTDAKSASVQ